MLSNSSLASRNYTVRVRCLLPSSSPPVLLEPVNSSLSMATSTKNIPSNSADLSTPNSSSIQSTCNFCKHILYSFEEILICRLCHGAYHWRCVKPKSATNFSAIATYICEKCAGSVSTSSTQRLPNAGIKIKPTDLTGTDYRSFASVPSKISATPTKDTAVVNAIRYFEDKRAQQLQQGSKPNEVDEQLLSQTNGQYTDDGKTIRPTQQQQQQNGLESGLEHTNSGMFQANYQYTPLKEYAATTSGRPTNNNTNFYQNSPPTGANHQATPYYNGDSPYTTHEYGPTNSRVVEPPMNNSTYYITPTVDNLSAPHRQKHFISTTNLNLNDAAAYRQPNDYRNSLNRSTPYLSQYRDNNSPTSKPSFQQQPDRHSIVGSDSGIVLNNQTPENSQAIERKITDLVQKIGQQFETDSQKLGEKLELKLKSLEDMINRQTYVIRRQDEVIENLKSKVTHIETERDHFRDRLSVHEPRDHDDKKYLTTTEDSTNTNDRPTSQQNGRQPTLIRKDSIQQNGRQPTIYRKDSSASSVNTERSRTSSKKTPAPKADSNRSSINNENESAIAQLIKKNPLNQENVVYNSTEPPIVAKLASSVPTLEKPPATSRLDSIIHQPNPSSRTNSTASSYNQPEARRQDQKQIIEPVSKGPIPLVSSIHHDDEQTESRKSSKAKSKRSSSSSTSPSSSSSPPASVRADTYDLTPTNNPTLAARNSNLHRSFDSIPRKTSQTEQGLQPTNKATSLDFNKKPAQQEKEESIYVTPQEASHIASQYQDTVRGWLRKQNRESFFKRVERYYCVLSNNNLLMHKRETDKTAQKAINLRGAKVTSYKDPKFGTALQLTWTSRLNAAKNYYLYAANEQEAQQWMTGIQGAIQNLDTNNKWQQQRINTQ